MNIFKKIILWLLKLRPFGKTIIAIYYLSKWYLQDEGWTKSAIERMPIDREGKEIPWYTYSSIKFIKNRIDGKFKVFEYGSGNSTIWYSRRVKKVVSVEHDKAWFCSVKNKLPKELNINYVFKDLDSKEYERYILNFQKEFDIIILDGRNRVNCCMNCLDALKEDGIVIWDNSDRTKYSDGFDFLTSNGFRRIDFWGMGPIVPFATCTSLFYRSANCFKI